MKVDLKFVLSVFLLSALSACSDASSVEPLVRRTKTIGEGDAGAAPDATRAETNSNRGLSLRLSWAPQAELSAYHIYYRDPKNKVLEIDSLKNTDLNFDAPQIAIDSSNMESWPKLGEKACFYVVAEARGVLSEPSDNACIVL